MKKTLTAALAATLTLLGANHASAIAWSDQTLADSAPGYVASLHSGKAVARTQFCSGALVAESWVLTAAHCFDGETPRTKIRIGGHTVRTVTEVHIPQQYTRVPQSEAYLHGFDIALVRLDRPVDDIEPVNLPGVTFEPGDQGRVYGFGLDQNNDDPQRLGARIVHIENGTWAERIYPFKPRRQISAIGIRNYRFDTDTGDVDEKTYADSAVCKGDSGGPLVIDTPDGDVVAGVVSYGVHCRQAAPSVYTKVAAHRSWIRGVLDARP